MGMMVACLACALLGDAELAAGTAASSSKLRAQGIVGAAIFFVFSFAYGWGPGAWVYTTEIFPTEHRSTAVALVTCTNWVGNYIIAFITPVLMDAIKFRTFYVFAAFCALAGALSLWLPETKGVPLEDMPQLFGPKLGERYVTQGLQDLAGA